jgi:Glycosyl transferase family 64 domain
VSGVTAVIQRYYSERLSYIRPILKSLSESSVVPEKVILWNNFPESSKELEFPFLDFPRLNFHIIHSSVNTLMGRYAAILLAETDYIYIQDDDLVLASDVIEKLLAAAKTYAGARVGPFGMDFGPDPEKRYTSGHAASGYVDVVLGRCCLASRRSMLSRLTATSDFIPFGRNDDIFMSDGGSVAVSGCGFTNLDERGVGLCHEECHFPERDAAARAVSGVSHDD